MHRKRSSWGLVALALPLIALTLASQSGAASPVATASRACSIQGQQRDFGASYVTSLKVYNTSCRKGKQVIRGYHRCRISSGGANGRCGHRVAKFRCHEGRRQGVPGVQYNAKVTCNRGERKITSTYTQNV